MFRWEPSLEEDGWRALVPYGSEATFTLHITTPDGAPYPVEHFRWIGSIDLDEPTRWRAEHVADGVERVTFIPTRDAWESIIGEVAVEDSGNHILYTPPTIRAEAFGGPPLALALLQGDVRVRVGEQRPVAALAVARRFPDKTDESYPNVWPSDTAATASIANGAIATVDARGVVTGLAPGATELVFTAGALTERIPLVVEEGALGPPPAGLHVVAGSPQSAAPVYAQVATSDSWVSSIALDATGAPLAIGEPDIAAPTYVSRHHVATLTRWTGSGLGTEIVSRPFENAVGARVVVDATGHQYVAYDDLRYQRIVVADRPSSSAPWRYRSVSNAIAGAEEVGQQTHETILDATWRGVAMIPRAGGGVWLAWRFAHLFAHDPAFEGMKSQCAQFVRLATLSATHAPEHQLVYELWADPVVTGTFDCEREIDNQTRVTLLPPPAGEMTATVVIGDVPLHIANGAWTLRDDLVDDEGAYLGDVGIDGGPRTLRSSGLSLAPLFPCPRDLALTSATRLGDGVVAAGPGPLWWLRPGRAPRCFELSFASTATEVTYLEHLVGLAGDATRLYVPMTRAQRPLALGVLDLGAEPAARPITQDDELPTDAVGPFVRADGTAFVLTSPSPYDGLGGNVRPGGVYRALPGGGWTRLGDRGGPAQNSTDLVFEHDGEVFGLSAGPTTRVQRSPDNGVTWLQHQTIALPEQAPYPSSLRGVVVTVLPGGDVAFVYIDRQYPEVWRIDHLTSAPVATHLADGGSPWLEAGAGGRWILDGTDVVLLQQVRVLRWRADGTFVSNTPISMPTGSTEHWNADHSVLASTGQPLGIHQRDQGGVVVFTVRVAAMGALPGAERSTLDLAGATLEGVHAPHLERLPDGRLLLVASRYTSLGDAHAFYRVSSDDGFTWSDEVSIDRGAGPRQFALGAALVPDGVLFVVGSTIDATLPPHQYLGHVDYRSITHALP